MPDSFYRMPQNMHTLLFMHMRHAFKTGLACLLSYWISYLLNSPYGLWAVASSLVVMQGVSVADSLDDSLHRFTAMSVGAITGMVLLIFAPSSELVLVFEIFMITSVGAYLTRYSHRYTLATSAVCIVLLAGRVVVDGSFKAALMFGLALTWEVALGVACAIIVSAVIWPIRLGDTLRADIDSQFEKCAELLETIMSAYIVDQHHVGDSMYEGLRLQIRSNHERMRKVRRMEARIYHFEHKGLGIQVHTIENCVEGMRALLDALNEYDEEAHDPLLGPEISRVGTALAVALRHLGSPEAYSPAPKIVRELTSSLDSCEERMGALRGKNSLRKLPLHRIIQLFSFYQILRQFTEELLNSMYELQVLGEQPMQKKERKATSPR